MPASCGSKNARREPRQNCAGSENGVDIQRGHFESEPDDAVAQLSIQLDAADRPDQRTGPLGA